MRKEPSRASQNEDAIAKTTDTATLHLLHELQAHQIELERQNEALTEAKNKAEETATNYANLYDFAPIGYIALNELRNITRSNLAAAKLLGIDRAQLHGRHFAGFLAESALPKFNTFITESTSHAPQTTCNVTLKGKELKVVQIDISASDDSSGFLEYRLVLTDITEHQQAQLRLQLAASVFTNAREGIMITNASGTIVEVNDTFTQITGYSREDAINQNADILNSGRQSPEFYMAMWHALTNKGHWYGEIWNRRKNGEIYPEIQDITSVCDAAGKAQHYVSMFSDITNIKAHQQQLEHAAHFDALTSLPNRALLADRLPLALLQSQRRGKMLAVVYLDLDGFKKVNDEHGHELGDQLLVITSQRMAEALREGDTLARIGGDEFVAVLVDLEEPADCEPILDRLLQAASQTVHLDGAALNVSASIGVALYPQGATETDLLLRQADQAMYIAKDTGKNRYHFFDIHSETATKELRDSLEQIRHGLDQDEFVLYYQPKVNLKTGAVIGVEALIRWQHPKRGLLEPGLFLPLVENYSIKVELGEWVINTALNQISEWNAIQLNLSVSVNVGAYQLHDSHFLSRLTSALKAHPDVEPSQLEIEIIETSALEDMSQVSELMESCKDLGVSFTLDDFGTGYSSLTYLKRLPAESLKIDLSFVRDMLTNEDDMAIVQGVIGLANVFHRRVIAEGVETAAHGIRLLALGCELAQGYGIARPMQASEVPNWVEAWQTYSAWTA